MRDEPTARDLADQILRLGNPDVGVMLRIVDPADGSQHDVEFYDVIERHVQKFSGGWDEVVLIGYEVDPDVQRRFPERPLKDVEPETISVDQAFEDIERRIRERIAQTETEKRYPALHNESRWRLTAFDTALEDIQKARLAAHIQARRAEVEQESTDGTSRAQERKALRAELKQAIANAVGDQFDVEGLRERAVTHVMASLEGLLLRLAEAEDARDSWRKSVKMQDDYLAQQIRERKFAQDELAAESRTVSTLSADLQRERHANATLHEREELVRTRLAKLTEPTYLTTVGGLKDELRALLGLIAGNDDAGE